MIRLKKHPSIAGVKSLLANLFLVTLIAAIAAFGASASPKAFGQAAEGQAADGNSGKPALVVSMTSIDQLMKDVNFLARAGGVPDLGVVANIYSAQFTNGLDRTKPSGALGMIEGDNLSIVAFVPVKDLKTFLKTLEPQIGAPVPADEGPEGVQRLGKREPYAYLLQQGGWAFIAQDPSALESLPMDPSALLDGLNTKYDVAARLYFSNIPEYMRKAAVSQVMSGYEAGIAEARARGGLGGGAIDPAMQEEIAKSMLQGINDLIEGADQLTLGWGVDSVAKNTFVEMSLTAVAGSKLAAQMGAVEQQTTDYGGFQQQDAAFSMNLVTTVRPEDMKSQKAQIAVMKKEALKAIDDDASLPNDEARTLAKDIVGSLIDALEHTLETGKLDGGAVVLLKPDALSLIGGGSVASGAELEAIFKKAVTAAANDPKFPGVKYDAHQHAGLRIHTIDFPIPAEEEEARQLLGESLNVAVGIGEKSFYFAVGKDNIEALKKVVDDSAANGGMKVPPLKMQVAARPILDFAAAIDGRPEIAALITLLDRAPGKDHVVVTAEPIERGATYRIVVEEGILQVLGQAAKMSGGAPGGF